jgi:D-alanyl-D-alanine carboxypeptidase
MRPEKLVLANATPGVSAPAAKPEIVTRLSTSGGHHWGVNVGRYTTRYKAEKVLLRTALAEMSTLDGTLRKVNKSSKGFEATFQGMTREQADLACRRLQARNVTCFMIGPS